MIIYNVTIKVATDIAEAWLTWLQQEHIPEILDTGCFTDARVLRLLETDDPEGETFTIQYHAESKALYNRYISMHAEELRDKSFKKWSNKFIAFRTVMQIVN